MFWDSHLNTIAMRCLLDQPILTFPFPKCQHIFLEGRGNFNQYRGCISNIVNRLFKNLGINR